MTASPYWLSLLKIPVTDIAAGVGFYRDVLGFEAQFVAPEYGWAQLASGDLAVALYVPGMGGGDGRVGGSAGFQLALPAGPFDTLAADLLARGVLVDDRVQRGDDGLTFVQIRDPDGNVLNVARMSG